MAEFGYYSQKGEDRWVVENLSLPERGVFVDVGAWDGVEASNTYHFEQKGWTGLCVEPLPHAFEKLKENRRCSLEQCAIGSDPTRRFYRYPHEEWLAGFDRSLPGAELMAVKTKRLEELLGRAHIYHIDLLSIDVEGSELDVWGTFDHDSHTPSVVIIEYNTASRPPAESAILAAFAPLPYKLVLRTEFNLIFERTRYNIGNDDERDHAA